MLNQLKYIISFTVSNYSESKNLRGISAVWENNVLFLKYYFNGPITDENKEDAQDLGTGIISHFSNGFLEEVYVRIDYPKPLPKEFLLYENEANFK